MHSVFKSTFFYFMFKKPLEGHLANQQQQKKTQSANISLSTIYRALIKLGSC